MLFDSHNHIHLGHNPIAIPVSSSLENTHHDLIAGIALMSTHPRDFEVVSEKCFTLVQSKRMKYAIPCYGIHPWFIHQMEKNDLIELESSSLSVSKTIDAKIQKLPTSATTTMSQWEISMLQYLESNPSSCVGEIGLDGSRWTDPVTRELSTPMHIQQYLFEKQMKIAAQLNKPVSIHVVNCWGPFFDSIKRLSSEKSKSKKKKNNTSKKDKLSKKTSNKSSSDTTVVERTFPSRIYMHAFGGKNKMVVNQVLKAFEKTDCSEIYFGFPPVISYRSPRVKEVIKAVGIDRLLLETDLENGANVYDDLMRSAQFTAETLEMKVDDVIEKTYINAKEFYGLDEVKIVGKRNMP